MAFQKFTKLILNIAQTATPASLLQVFNELQNNIDTTFLSLNKIQNDSTILTNVELVTGQVNIINHRLGRKLAGWKVVRQRSEAAIWDSQDDNTANNLTLWLRTDQNVTVDLEVF